MVLPKSLVLGVDIQLDIAVKLYTCMLVSCPDPTLSQEKGLEIIEFFLGCAKSAILIFEQANDYIITRSTHAYDASRRSNIWESQRTLAQL